MNKQQMNDQLYVAVRDNKIDLAKEYLAKGADINHNDGEPIYTATILDNHHEMLRVLIDAGADTNIKRHRSIKTALTKGDAISLEMLLEPKGVFENFNSDFPNALKLACDKNEVMSVSYGVVKTLLEKGSDVHYFDDLAVKSAVISNEPEIVDLLLENGANFHALGDYAFRQAAIKDYGKVLEVAIIKHNLTPTQESLDWMKEKDCSDFVENLIAKRELNKKLTQSMTPKPKQKIKGLTMKI
jgi:ankyrin repeat protein